MLTGGLTFSLHISMVDPAFYLPVARAAEVAGFDRISMGDSIFYPLESDSRYPYTADGGREFLENKPFLEPFSIIPAMAAVTTRIQFAVVVLKLPVRHPVLVAKQASSVAVISGNRLRLGVGTSPWPDDFEILGVPYEGRGRRLEEGIAVIRGLTAGGYFEHHGEHYDFRPIKLAPVPTGAHPNSCRRPFAHQHPARRAVRRRLGRGVRRPRQARSHDPGVARGARRGGPIKGTLRGVGRDPRPGGWR